MQVVWLKEKKNQQPVINFLNQVWGNEEWKPLSSYLFKEKLKYQYKDPYPLGYS